MKSIKIMLGGLKTFLGRIPLSPFDWGVYHTPEPLERLTPPKCVPSYGFA